MIFDISVGSGAGRRRPHARRWLRPHRIG